MENLLQGIPHVIVRMDDILISGKDDNNHIANLEAVLKKLSEAVAVAERKVFLHGAGSHLMWLCDQWSWYQASRS